MKRANRLLSRVADPDNLRLAAWKAAKGKRHASEVVHYFGHLETNISILREQILSGEVVVGAYRYFKVYEPKERQICAAAFSEQVLHHALMNVCHERFERAQIFDSYASRKGKGTYAALHRAKIFNRPAQWFLKLDVRKFFESIHHEVLLAQLARLFADQAILGIFEKIIGSYEAAPQRGLPIGNLTSQYFANHYLVGLDHFIKERLQIKAYVRYMDDLVLWHSSKKILKEAHEEMNELVERGLLCQLKPILLRRTETGLPFLGYHIFPFHVRLLQASKVRFVRKMTTVEHHFQDETWSESKCQRHILPLFAFTQHADAENLCKNLFLRLKGQSP